MIASTGKNFKKIHEVRMTRTGWFNMELPNEGLFPFSKSCTVKLCFTHFHSSNRHEIILHFQNHATTSPNYNWEWSQTDKDYWRKLVSKLYLVSIAKDKSPGIRIKMNQTFFSFYNYLPYVASLCTNLFSLKKNYENKT